MKKFFNPFLFACVLCSSMNIQSRFQNLTKTIDGSEIVQMSVYQHKGNRRKGNYDITEVLSHVSLETNNVHSSAFVVYGNTPNFKASDFRSIVYEGNDKIYLHYRTDHTIPLPYDALLIFKKKGKLISYEFKESVFSTSKALKDEIISFIRRSYDKYLEQLSEEGLNNNISLLADNDVPQTFINCEISKNFQTNYGKHGYINFQLGVRRYQANNVSSLYILYIDADFVPGRVARINGNTSDYSDCLSDYGYFHLDVMKAYDRTEEQIYGTRYGAEIYTKDYWPVNEPTKVTITSSVTEGWNFGFSFENGFSLDNISSSFGPTYGHSISETYSKAITIQDPLLSAQRYYDEAQWSFSYQGDGVANSLTYHLSMGYMFESRNDGGAMSEGDFRVKIESQMGFKCKSIFGTHNLRNNKTINYDLMVRSIVNKDVFDFNDGIF